MMAIPKTTMVASGSFKSNEFTFHTKVELPARLNREDLDQTLKNMFGRETSPVSYKLPDADGTVELTVEASSAEDMSRAMRQIDGILAGLVVFQD